MPWKVRVPVHIHRPLECVSLDLKKNLHTPGREKGRELRFDVLDAKLSALACFLTEITKAVNILYLVILEQSLAVDYCRGKELDVTCVLGLLRRYKPRESTDFLKFCLWFRHLWRRQNMPDCCGCDSGGGGGRVEGTSSPDRWNQVLDTTVLRCVWVVVLRIPRNTCQNFQSIYY